MSSYNSSVSKLFILIISISHPSIIDSMDIVSKVGQVYQSAKPYIPFTLLGYVLLLVAVACFALYINSRYQTALPNQWMLVIRGGQLKGADIGLRQFIFPGDTIVKFPSRVERVEFKAMNVTEEMQGISIEGFAFWIVDREAGGPLKCYKYMDGGNANRHVKTLCESIVRNELANCKLANVMKNRDLFKQNIRKELGPQLKKWGIWLETVELTDVKICSKKVFDDLQAEFRMETNLKAETIRIDARTKTEMQKLASELKILKNKQEGETERLKSTLQQQLKRVEQDTTYEEQNSTLEIKQLNQDKQLELQRRRKNQQISLAQQKNEHEKKLKNLDLKLQNERKDIEKIKTYTPTALKIHNIDSLERIYERFSFENTKISTFVPENERSIFSLLPGFSEIIHQAKEEK